MEEVYRTPTAPPSQTYFSGQTALRVTATQKRRLFMEQGWPSLLSQRLRDLLSDAYLLSIRSLDASHNIYRDTIGRLATRYESAPILKDGDIGDLDMYELFSEHMTVEKYALAYNASVVSIRVSKQGELIVEVLPPDHVDVQTDGDNSIVRLRLARPIIKADNPLSTQEFVIEEWDIRDPANPKYLVFSNGKMEAKPTYPWKYANSEPFIPVVLYRASKPPDFWGADRWYELIEATLEEGIAWTIHRYGRLNSSSGIVYSMDSEPVGQGSDGDDTGSKTVTAGNGFVLQMKSMSNKTGSIGVVAPTFDPSKDVESIDAAFNSRMNCLGIGDAAVQRTTSAQSGVAIVLKRDGLERLRRSTEPTFRRADAAYIRKAVACMRIFAGGPVESGYYKIDYAPVSVGQSDNSERRNQEQHDISIGVASPASVIADREGVPVDQAQAELAEKGIQPAL